MMYLMDCFQPVLRLACQLPQPDGHPDYQEFRQHTLETFQKSITATQQLAISVSDAEDTLFAMAVWFDEMVLRSELPFKHHWRNELLQTHYFNTVIGGEEFFTRMDNITPDNISLRLVYLHCLLLGFHGKYHHCDSGLLVKKMADERLALPVPWHEWPNNGAITPSHFATAKKDHGILFRFVNARYSILWILVIEYGLLSGMLLALA